MGVLIFPVMLLLCCGLFLVAASMSEALKGASFIGYGTGIALGLFMVFLAVRTLKTMM